MAMIAGCTLPLDVIKRPSAVRRSFRSRRCCLRAATAPAAPLSELSLSRVEKGDRAPRRVVGEHPAGVPVIRVAGEKVQARDTWNIYFANATPRGRCFKTSAGT